MHLEYGPFNCMADPLDSAYFEVTLLQPYSVIPVVTVALSDWGGFLSFWVLIFLSFQLASFAGILSGSAFACHRIF